MPVPPRRPRRSGGGHILPRNKARPARGNHDATHSFQVANKRQTANKRQNCETPAQTTMTSESESSMITLIACQGRWGDREYRSGCGWARANCDRAHGVDFQMVEMPQIRPRSERSCLPRYRPRPGVRGVQEQRDQWGPNRTSFLRASRAPKRDSGSMGIGLRT